MSEYRFFFTFEFYRQSYMQTPCRLEEYDWTNTTKKKHCISNKSNIGDDSTVDSNIGSGDSSIDDGSVSGDNDVNLEFTPISAQLTLSNPRFGDCQYVHDVWGAALPDYAIDGKWLDFITYTHDFNVIACSYSDQNPTFIVDLPNSQTIVDKIIIYPRQDGHDDGHSWIERYSQMAVRVDNNYCEASQSLDSNTIEANKETGIIFQCNNVSGSVITVENGNYHLQIAEIEAFEPSTVTSTMTATTTEHQGNERNPPRYRK